MRPATSAHRFGPVACRRCFDVRTTLTIFGCVKGTPCAPCPTRQVSTSRRPIGSRPQHSSPILRHDCPLAFQYLCRHLRLIGVVAFIGAELPVCLRRHCSGVGFGPSNRPNDQISSGCPVRRSLSNFWRPYSNLEATRAVFAEMSRRGISSDRIICTGDIIACGAAPSLPRWQVA